LYRATDAAGPFITSLATPYNRQLRERAEWAVGQFADLEPGELGKQLNRLFDAWAPQFQAIQKPGT
jgi:hypothetical protein